MEEKDWKQYRRTNIAEMRSVTTYEAENNLLDEGISVSDADKKNGSPNIGDMIARNPQNHDDKWLVAKKYFEDNFEVKT